jgi:uncharacterized protein YjbJ (UPF0337 family)
MINSDKVKGLWDEKIGDAKITWGKLTDNELKQTEGHFQKLSGLVQQRYGVAKEEAARQVNNFLEKHHMTA